MIVRFLVILMYVLVGQYIGRSERNKLLTWHQRYNVQNINILNKYDSDKLCCPSA